MYFEWDKEKAESNLLKHGVAFEEASWVFNDPCCLTSPDRRRDYGETRWNTIGMPIPFSAVILHVTHTVEEDRNGEETIRIISARKANPGERRLYARFNP